MYASQPPAFCPRARLHDGLRCFVAQFEAAKSPLAPRGNLMPPLTPVPDADAQKPLPATEKEERRARESEWENEGGSVRQEQKPAAQATLANDNDADSA